ncbi:MAG: zeta toxin family protein [Betaproteobacteria bacterium]|nr:zeta toxin family protein [Betaproteobacteria bacterium]
MDSPHLIIIAGPNGAGKSTSAPILLKETLRVVEFVNADVIAQGLSAFNVEGAAFQAGRAMLERLHYLAKERVDFAFETTMASRSFAPWIAELKAAGYRFHLVFLWLPSPQLAIERVAERARLGGHHVSAATVKRRYGRGLRNFFDLYQPMADTWRFYDNSQLLPPRLVAHGCGKIVQQVANSAIWRQLTGD